jgi:hypothetical protein
VPCIRLVCRPQGDEYSLGLLLWNMQCSVLDVQPQAREGLKPTAWESLLVVPFGRCAAVNADPSQHHLPVDISSLCGLPGSEQGREVRVCSTFANSGPLPLLFVDALFRSHPDPTLRPRAVAYISFYLLAWSPLFWTYGYRYARGRCRSRVDNRETLLHREREQAGCTCSECPGQNTPQRQEEDNTFLKV